MHLRDMFVDGVASAEDVVVNHELCSCRGDRCTEEKPGDTGTHTYYHGRKNRETQGDRVVPDTTMASRTR